MQIQINSVDSVWTKNGKTGYGTLTVNYNNERGEAKSWKLVSFNNPAVYKTISEAKEGDAFDITTGETTGKDGKDYTVWKSAARLDPSATTRDVASGTLAPRTGTSTGKVLGSTYETKEERAVRQRLIVRQSSLANAIEFAKWDQDAQGDVDMLLEIAEKFTAWVFQEPDLLDTSNDLGD